MKHPRFRTSDFTSVSSGEILVLPALPSNVLCREMTSCFHVRPLSAEEREGQVLVIRWAIGTVYCLDLTKYDLERRNKLDDCLETHRERVRSSSPLLTSDWTDD